MQKCKCPIGRSRDPFLSLTCIVNSSLTSLPLSSRPSHPLAHPQLSPSYSLKETPTSDTRLSTSGDTERAFKTFSHSARNPSKIKTLLFFSLHVFINALPNKRRERVAGLCEGDVRPFPQFWLTSESSSTCIRWFHMGSVCAEGEVEGHIHPVCFSHFHCCSSPWFPLSVSSLGRHPSTGALTLCSCSWL